MKLTVFAFHRARRLTWRGAHIVKGGAVPGGYEEHDFVSDAITKALDETREWNREAYPTLEDFLRSIIQSDINHLAESMDNVRGRRLDGSFENDDTAQTLPGSEPRPDEVVADELWREHYREQVLGELDGDQLLIDLFRCYEAEVTEPNEIAQRLGRLVFEIYNAKKRLRRALANVDARTRQTHEPR